MMCRQKLTTTGSSTTRHHPGNGHLEEPTSYMYKTLDVQQESLCDNRPAVHITSSSDTEEKVKKYSYAGPPKISLSTWNERPKRQVSIKTDRDYVIGIRQRLQQKSDAVSKLKDSDTKTVSRVPIVKSVELKKPYAEQLLQSSSPVLALSEVIKAQAKLSNGYSYNGNKIVTATDDDNTISSSVKKEQDSCSFTFGQLMGRTRKPREISTNVDPRESLLESIRSFGGRDNLRKIRA